MKWLAIAVGVVAIVIIIVAGRAASDRPGEVAAPGSSGGAGPAVSGAIAGTGAPGAAAEDERFDGGVLAAPPVDLVALRARLPDNVYWEEGVPTADPVVLERRATKERSRNALWGRIQAGEASEDELHAYFEAQRRLHQDYVTLCRTVLDQEGARLSERDRGLYELGERMHRDRLDALGEQERAAMERKRLQDRRRQDWEREGRPVPAER